MTAGTWKWPRLHTRRLLTVLLIGSMFSFYAAHAVHSFEREKQRVQFENSADGHIALIKFAFETRLKEISALRLFFENSAFVSVDEFRLFVEPFITEEAATSAVEWIPRVTAGELITEYDPRGGLVGALNRDFHFPIRYVEPLERNRTAIGVDLASDALSIQAMEKARDTAEPGIAPQARVFQGEKDSHAFRIIYPVYHGQSDNSASRRSNLLGFVAGLYRYSDIVEATLFPMPPSGLDVSVSDIGDPEKSRLMYVHPSRTRSEDMTFPADALGEDVSMRYRSTFTLADRVLEIACTPAPGFYSSGVSWAAWMVLFGGVMLTGLLTVHFNFLMERNREVGVLVAERTEALHESRTRLELAFSGAELGYWDWRVQTGEMTFGGRWADMVGYSQEDLIPNVSTWRRSIHPEDKEKVLTALRRHLEGLSLRFEAEYRMLHRDGHYIWVLNRGRVLERDDAGKALRACGTHLDVTSRKLANQARDLLTAAVEQFGETLIISDATGRIQYVNSAFERTSGYSRDEVIGEFPHLLPGGHPHEELSQEIFRTVDSGKTWQGVIDSKKKDGTHWYENAMVSPVFDEDGNISHHVTIRHDLTDLKRLEQEKKNVEMQYQQAQKLESIGRLAGGVAHDLNNLLGPILGYADMIMEKTDREDGRYEGLDMIRQSALRARDVVRQLLAFSRKQSLSIRKVDLSSVAEGLQDLLRRTLLENIRIDYHLRSPLIVKADVGQLEQVIMNLVVNAQDAMPGGGLLVIETAAVELDGVHIRERSGATNVKPGPYAMLQVSDTGHGMEKETLEYIFEPFFSTKDQSKGTGLGLSMVYGTVKQHGGYVWAYSEPGKGSSLKIYLPLMDAPAQASPKDEQTPPDQGEETILVVEDDRSLRNMVVKMLSQKNYNVLTAAGGTECLELLERLDRPVDVLLTDVIMPDMNGKELFTRAERKFPGLKVIYMSGYTDDIIAYHGVLPGDVHFLQKPFSVRDVVSKIRKVLDEA